MARKNDAMAETTFGIVNEAIEDVVSIDVDIQYLPQPHRQIGQAIFVNAHPQGSSASDQEDWKE